MTDDFNNSRYHVELFMSSESSWLGFYSKVNENIRIIIIMIERQRFSYCIFYYSNFSGVLVRT